MRVDVGAALPEATAPGVALPDVAGLARLAERAGLDCLWAGDRLVAGQMPSPILGAKGNREFLFVWERVRDVVPELRKAFSSPIELKHLELVSQSYIQWWIRQAPGAYEAFSKRVRG